MPCIGWENVSSYFIIVQLFFIFLGLTEPILVSLKIDFLLSRARAICCPANCLMKSLDKTDFLSFMCSLFPRATFRDFIWHQTCLCMEFDQSDYPQSDGLVWSSVVKVLINTFNTQYNYKILLVWYGSLYKWTLTVWRNICKKKKYSKNKGTDSGRRGGDGGMGNVWISLGHISLYFSSTSPFYYLWLCVKLLAEWQTV